MLHQAGQILCCAYQTTVWEGVSTHKKLTDTHGRLYGAGPCLGTRTVHGQSQRLAMDDNDVLKLEKSVEQDVEGLQPCVEQAREMNATKEQTVVSFCLGVRDMTDAISR